MVLPPSLSPKYLILFGNCYIVTMKLGWRFRGATCLSPTQVTVRWFQVNPELVSVLPAYVLLSWDIYTGKTVFLNNVLVHRLQAKLVTIFCDVGTHAYVFSDKGVRRVSLGDGARIPELDDNPHSCALVNLGAQLLQPPNQFYPSGRLGRLVVAASPNPAHPAHVICFRERPALTTCRRGIGTISIVEGEYAHLNPARY